MASNINPTLIDITYPIAGQDNDTQGFRNNYQVIQTNFTTAATEITALQSNSISVQTTVLTNGVVQLANLTQTQVAAIVPSSGMMVYNNTYGNIQGYSSHLGRWGNITLS
jgi:hypothetical protein